MHGLAWLGWVLGAALLVGLAFLLLRVFDTDGDEVATDPADAATGTSQAPDPGAGQTDGSPEPTDDGGGEAPAGVGKALDLARGATFEVPGTAPPTTDFDGNLVAYEASQMGDGNPATAWRTAGDATGGTITVTLTEPGVVTRVGLVNGYAKQVAGVDWYPNNRRILVRHLGLRRRLDRSSRPSPSGRTCSGSRSRRCETSTVTITINAVTPPGSGSLGRDYTAISEVSVRGRRAG